MSDSKDGHAPASVGTYNVQEPIEATDGLERYLGKSGAQLVEITVIRADPSGSDVLAARELTRVVGALAKTSSEHLVRVLSSGTEDDLTFVASQHLPGMWLSDVLSSRGVVEAGLEAPVALRLLRDVARGLDALHGVDVAHGDLRRRTILLCKDGIVRLGGLGIGSVAPMLPLSSATRTARLPYRPPNELRGRPADVASDIYSFGILLHELLVDAHDVPEPLREFGSRLVATRAEEPKVTAREVVEALEDAARSIEPASRATIARLASGAAAPEPRVRPSRDPSTGRGEPARAPEVATEKIASEDMPRRAVPAPDTTVEPAQARRPPSAPARSVPPPPPPQPMAERKSVPTPQPPPPPRPTAESQSSAPQPTAERRSAPRPPPSAERTPVPPPPPAERKSAPPPPPVGRKSAPPPPPVGRKSAPPPPPPVERKSAPHQPSAQERRSGDPSGTGRVAPPPAPGSTRAVSSPPLAATPSALDADEDDPTKVTGVGAQPAPKVSKPPGAAPSWAALLDDDSRPSGEVPGTAPFASAAGQVRGASGPEGSLAPVTGGDEASTAPWASAPPPVPSREGRVKTLPLPLGPDAAGQTQSAVDQAERSDDDAPTSVSRPVQTETPDADPSASATAAGESPRAPAPAPVSDEDSRVVPIIPMTSRTRIIAVAGAALIVVVMLIVWVALPGGTPSSDSTGPQRTARAPSVPRPLEAPRPAAPPPSAAPASTAEPSGTPPSPAGAPPPPGEAQEPTPSGTDQRTNEASGPDETSSTGEDPGRSVQPRPVRSEDRTAPGTVEQASAGGGPRIATTKLGSGGDASRGTGRLVVSCERPCTARVDGTLSPQATRGGAEIRSGPHAVIVTDRHTGYSVTMHVAVPAGGTIQKHLRF